MTVYCDDERLEFDEYFDFLKRTDLGSQYPKQNFEARIRTLLRNADVCITARAAEGKLIGVAMGVTDGAYFLFLTDLGVDRDFVRQGIGRELLARAHAKAGGEADITMTTIANDEAFAFYESCGMKNRRELYVKYCREWEEFVVE